MNMQKVLEQAKEKRIMCEYRLTEILYELSEEIKLDKNKKHNIEIVVDRLVVKEGIEKRLTDSIENVLELSNGLLMVDIIDGETMQFLPELFLSGLWNQY